MKFLIKVSSLYSLLLTSQTYFISHGGSGGPSLVVAEVSPANEMTVVPDDKDYHVLGCTIVRLI